jgi:predicted RNA binding protein YcfA (HicA-like mRNA interferase family)
MSYKRATQITVSGEWARHLRPWGKREFWKAERRAYVAHASEEATAARAEYDAWHMPTKVQELIARLEADGWFQVRQKGSHRQFHHASRPGTVTVAGKPSVEVPPGTLTSILKQAGLKK